MTLRAHERQTVAELLDEAGMSMRARKRLFAQGTLARDALLAAGESLEVPLYQTRTPGPASDEPVELVWLDRFACLANKPTGILVHSDGTGAQEASRTLTARVQGTLTRMAAEQGWDVVPTAQAINRLDVDTSGLVLFSLTEEFQPAFDTLVASHDPTRIRKRYLCVVRGTFPQGPVLIDKPIARDRHDARRMRVGKTGKPSQTLAVRLDHRGDYSLVACELRSGRKHQIRVHLSSMGHSIVGDALYGVPDKRDRTRKARQAAGGRRDTVDQSLMLHAYGLGFTHPVTGERIIRYTEWPGRFAALFSPRAIDWSILVT